MFLVKRLAAYDFVFTIIFLVVSSLFILEIKKIDKDPNLWFFN